MNMQELLNNHPKTAAVIKQWLLDKLINSINEKYVPEDFREYAKQQTVSDENVVGILSGSPRTMFDIFDQHKLFISVIAHNQGFIWYINDADLGKEIRRLVS